MDKFRTLLRLGPSNFARVGIYRLSLKFGFHPVQAISAPIPSGRLFKPVQTTAPKGCVARNSWHQNSARIFGQDITPYPELPQWHGNALVAGASQSASQDWWNISDFDPNVGDIKGIWEASRFDWLIAMAQRAALGDAGELERANIWLVNWLEKNPPYKGANWKCGQEASIRVIHLALAACIVGQIEETCPALLSFVELHLKRIAPTIGYAIGQANNHGTSEAAALFIGGSWLAKNNIAAGNQWAKIGRKWLENRAQALIEPDGSFSQYSVNYHRMMLDTYCFVEVWRQKLKLAEFSRSFFERLGRSTQWLQQMAQVENGLVPNIGANDGSQILALTDSSYRDFRPSIQLACAIFLGACAFIDDGLYNQQLLWLGVDMPHKKAEPLQSITFDDGGYHILRKGNAVAYLRYPRFRFRPSQADILHCDLFLNGENLLRDAGTYSYNSSHEDLVYFNGTKAHNTIEFDDKDQMPRLGRFLFGNWVKTKSINKINENENRVTAGASYQGPSGENHSRVLQLEHDKLVCIDEISGFKDKAVLRWRLAPGAWKLDGDTLSDGVRSIIIKSTVAIKNIEILEGRESLYYMQQSILPVLTVTLTNNEKSSLAQITTTVRF